MGAYYLMGYAVECALKACIAKQIRRHDFPDKQLANEAYVHDLQRLLKLAGLETDFRSATRSSSTLEANWAVVKDWSEQSRYDLKIRESDARGMHSACTGRNGILTWIRARW